MGINIGDANAGSDDEDALVILLLVDAQRPANVPGFKKAVRRAEFFPSMSTDREVIQVYDLKADPKETGDLSKAMPEQAAAFLRSLRSLVSAAP